MCMTRSIANADDGLDICRPEEDYSFTSLPVRSHRMEFWKSKFNQQALTQEQAEHDLREGCRKVEMRKRKRSRWYSYMRRALGNSQLGMALITVGFEVCLNKLATVHAQATAAGDASSLPSSNLRQRALSMR